MGTIWDNCIAVTGGAGMIGSCMVRMLNDRGMDNILIVDNIASTEKWKNLSNKRYREYIHKSRFLERLRAGDFPFLSGIIHLGACSSTAQRDFDYLWDNNVQYSKELWLYCTEQEIPLLYASSAATYGDGAFGFDDRKSIVQLRPLNGYGYSKQLFDLWAESQEKTPVQHAGFKFFNVYGPNEYCKGNMASMVFHGFCQIKQSGTIRLFKSKNPVYADGEQLRDFVYVKDVCKVLLFFMEHPHLNGLYNVGTGSAQSFRDLAEAVFSSIKTEPSIEYIDMPDSLASCYQYFTQANIEKLRSVGYEAAFQALDEGVNDYVTSYLNNKFSVF